jgi:uncharacterized BrkB/YihY/UPF0761 family membrane protein
VVMLTWLWLSSFIALLGAVINAEAERTVSHHPSRKTHEGS